LPGGGGIDLPLPDVGREGAVGGGVAARAAAGRSSTDGVERVGGAGWATGGNDAAAGRSIGAGGGGGGVGDERTTLPVERTTAGFGAGASPAAGAIWVTGTAAGASGAGGAGAGSGSASTTGSRLSPRESARRRTRSADGSSMLEE